MKTVEQHISDLDAMKAVGAIMTFKSGPDAGVAIALLFAGQPIAVRAPQRNRCKMRQFVIELAANIEARFATRRH